MWETTNSDVCSVSQDGSVQALMSGTANITAAIQGTDHVASIGVSVNIALTTLQVNPNTINLTNYKENQSVAVQLNSGATGNVSWNSSNQKVFTVDENGNVTAQSKGIATLNATVNSVMPTGTLSQSIQVSVNIQANELNLNVMGVVLQSLDTTFNVVASLNAGAKETIVWSSSSENIFTVNSNGVITPVGAGLATLNVSVPSASLSQSIPVNIALPVTVINLSQSLVTFNTLSSKKITINYTPQGSFEPIVWTVSNPAVCTVDMNGNIQSLGAGETLITVSLVDNSSIYATVNVTVSKQ